VVKKSWDHLSLEQRRAMIVLEHPKLSIRRQCELLGLHRSGLYYEPVEESAENVVPMLVNAANHEKGFITKRRSRGVSPAQDSTKLVEWRSDRSI
jgi:hypothetical protein